MEPKNRKHLWSRLLAGLITLILLAVIYARIDRNLMLEHLANVNGRYLLFALAMFIPLILTSALRWHLLTVRYGDVSFGESTRLYLAGKALNALVPSKMGDFSKAYFLRRDRQVGTARAVSAVILEKVLNVAGLCAVILLGVLITPVQEKLLHAGALVGAFLLAGVLIILLVPLGRLGTWISGLNVPFLSRFLDDWWSVVRDVRGRPAVLVSLLAVSLVIWILVILQHYLFFPALGRPVPLGPALSLLPMATLAGLLPITLGGMGTRDAALILLFAPYADPPLLASVGLLCTMRHWVDTLIGVPFFYRYSAKTARRKDPPGIPVEENAPV